MKWEGRVACMGGEERRIQGFGGETGGKETTWEIQARWEDNINLLTPNVNYSGRTAPLTSKFAFYIFIQQI